MNKFTLISLSVAGGILSGLAWTSWFTGLILLFAFTPFLIIEDHIFRNKKRYPPEAYFIYILPGFVIFNIVALGWIRAVSMISALSVIAGMSFLMAFIMWSAHIVRIKAGNLTGIVAFVAFWLALEYFTLNSVYLTPWINLGNGLAKDTGFIQWYEVTGTAGGTLWVLSSNLLLALIILNKPHHNKHYKIFPVLWLLLIFIPSFISLTIFYTIQQPVSDRSEVLIIQPNIDPYSEKYSMPFTDQLSKVLSLAGEVITDSTSWVLTPETTVDDPADENDMDNNKYIGQIREFGIKNPGAAIVAGLVTFRSYAEQQDNLNLQAGIRRNFYEHFNSAVQIDSGKVTGIYNKSKLVPGVEMQFSAGLGKFINKIIPELGGTKWGYGVQKERECFTHPGTGQIVAPIICYESVYGNFVADYVRQGAEALFIITNDGWWVNTSGYMQHLWYASLRAIETRRPVARAANTGISAIIDIRGKRISETGWWEETTLTGEIFSGNSITPYVRYGDYLMKISAAVSLLVLLYVFIALPLKSKEGIKQ